MTNQSPQRTRLHFVPAAAIVVVTAVGVGWGIGQFRQARETTRPSEARSVASKRGALLFQASCASCHGPDGQGDGVSAAALKPPPRDFAARPWRFEPTKESIRRVIRIGIPGSAMPGNPSLDEADLDSLVQHVYALATSRTPVANEPSADERLLKDAGFVNLHGADPPRLTVSDVSGRVTKLADLKGKLVIVNFWGMNCVHCLKEMPSLAGLEAHFAGRGLTVLHVCADSDDASQSQALLDKHVPGTKTFSDNTGLGLARFDVQALPAFWLIAPDGTAMGRTSGTVDWRSAAVIEMIERWLPDRTN